MTCQHTTRKGRPCPFEALGKNPDGRMGCHLHWVGGNFQKNLRDARAKRPRTVQALRNLEAAATIDIDSACANRRFIR